MVSVAIIALDSIALTPNLTTTLRIDPKQSLNFHTPCSSVTRHRTVGHYDGTLVKSGIGMAQEESLWAGGDELYAWNKVWKFRDCFGVFLKVRVRVVVSAMLS